MVALLLKVYNCILNKNKASILSDNLEDDNENIFEELTLLEEISSNSEIFELEENIKGISEL